MQKDVKLPNKAESIQFQVIQAVSLKEGNKQLTNLMKTIRPNSSEPMILCLQTNRKTNEFLDTFSCLKDLPNVSVGQPEQSGLMNMIDWGNFMTKRVCQHFLNLQVYLDDLLAISQYAGIPIGNIPQDVTTFTLDLFFARSLQERNHILWASRSGYPDFGGKEIQDYRLTSDWDNICFKENNGSVINEEIFEYNNCVADLEIGALAVTALIQNVRIIEAEGTSEYIGFSNAATNVSIDKFVSNGMRPTTSITEFDEAASLSGVMKVLRIVFHELIKHIHEDENTFADQLVMNLYRWLSDTNSLLYNPAIFSNINILMRKLCLLLSTEINHFGGNVIHSSFSRLIISTGRSDVQQSRIFISSLGEALSNNQMFAAMQITPVHLWNCCLWIDSVSF